MSSVPLPWCTSKSTIATRCRPWRSSAYLAAIATLLKKQKPIARSWQAWWPGGRTAQNALCKSPAITASVAASTAPAPHSTASQVLALSAVSGSTCAYDGPPREIPRRKVSLRLCRALTCRLSWASSMSARAAGPASRRCNSCPKPERNRRSSMASSRSGRSGWPGPMSCLRQSGWVK